ncbi:MAG: SCF ubiquitin ligase complex subunit [Pycnora praestabilis]|nr:MAG: SCF ubiquitin ligase complex subunit [Pycnora praestabilis]
MARARTPLRVSSNRTPESSSSSSPERAAYDDTDFFMTQANDSQSSVGISTFSDMTVTPAREREAVISPVSRLPPELLIGVFAKLGSTTDLRNCILVSRTWARNSVDLLWHRPLLNNWDNLNSVISAVQKTDGFFGYADLVKRLNLANPELTERLNDGTVQCLQLCKRVERLTLTSCSGLTDFGVTALVEGNRSLLALDISGLSSVTDHSLEAVADNCPRLQGLNITGCVNITDKAMIAVSENCRHIKRVKLNDCSELTDDSIISLATKCPQMLEIDLHGVKAITHLAVTSLIANGRHLRELRLAHCSLITDDAFLRLPARRNYESLRILDLTACDQLEDDGVDRIITAAPRLRNLVLAKCKKITDRAIASITKLGKNLHYVHLGHCQQITDGAVIQLVKMCNRIRYIDLACCHKLTDASIQQLANLPKLRRIGLVKCLAITDRSILALAKAKPGPGGGPLSSSSLERVHLSYCVHLTLGGIHALLNHCPKLTHLSLTGVQAFLREELTVFCRDAPAEFTDHQRDVFCVFSGVGVNRLRLYLNEAAHEVDYDGTMYDPDAEDAGEDEDDQQVAGMVAGLQGAMALGEGDEMDEEFGDGSETEQG